MVEKAIDVNILDIVKRYIDEILLLMR